MQRNSLKLGLELGSGRGCAGAYCEEVSTSEDSPPSHDCHPPRLNPEKEKSQLCKKFMEYGSCPYQKRCKFAHGSHELRKDHHRNSKYKTKHCGVFVTEGYCMYGNRCNFIHVEPKSDLDSGPTPFQVYAVKLEIREASRLLQLLD